MTDFIQSLGNFAISAILSVAMLLAWGGVCYCFFRHARAETEGRMRRFLETNHRVFTEKTIGKSRQHVTAAGVREVGYNGWIFACLPAGLLTLELSLPSVLVSSGMLFFGGYALARSWYALRCLHKLGLDQYTPLALLVNSSGRPPSSNQTRS